MNSKPTIIYLVRHGESEHNKKEIISGQVNPGLTANGLEQAHKAKQSLGHVVFDTAYSSDLDRAVTTAEIVFGKALPKLNRLVSLRERNFGSIDGKHRRNLDGFRETQQTMSMKKSWAHKHVPDMESDEELAQRFLVELENLARKHPGQTILIGSHGTSMRTLLRKLRNEHPATPPSKLFNNGGYLKLIYKDDRFVIDDVNGYN